MRKSVVAVVVVLALGGMPTGVRSDAEEDFSRGWAYHVGDGVEKNDAVAVHWWRKAAEQGDLDAQYNLGVMYHKGKGVEQDLCEALGWFRLAAFGGDIDAQNNLGGFLAEGSCTDRDLVGAHAWYSVAAAGGNKLAISNMAIIGSMLDDEGLRAAQERASLYYNIVYGSSQQVQ